jgi:hypothetical protein
MKYSREEYPARFSIQISTKENHEEFKGICRELSIESLSYWDQYREETIYFIDDSFTVYGSKTSYIEGVKGQESIFMGYTHYNSVSDFKERVTSLLSENDYEIY